MSLVGAALQSEQSLVSNQRTGSPTRQTIRHSLGVKLSQPFDNSQVTFVEPGIAPLCSINVPTNMGLSVGKLVSEDNNRQLLDS